MTETKKVINTVIDGGRDMKEKRERKPFEPRKVLIRPNKNGDSRTAEKCPTFGDFENANKSHRSEVREMMKQFGMLIIERGKSHDWTKVKEPQKSQFYADLCNAVNNKADFTKGEWYPMHCKTERHHLNSNCPDDVNMIDVVEMIADCVCAGMARSGSVYPIEIDSAIIQKAIDNTVQYMIDELIEIKDYSSKPQSTPDNHPVSKVDIADTEIVDANEFDNTDNTDSNTPKNTFSPKEKKVFTKTK